jgi:hypothetical protein
VTLCPEQEPPWRSGKVPTPPHENHQGRHRFEHWYRDNTVYFITAKVRDGKHLFNSEEATRIFWDRTLFYFKEHGFVPWVITLMVDHYHFPGYLKKGVRKPNYISNVAGFHWSGSQRSN